MNRGSIEFRMGYVDKLSVTSEFTRGCAKAVEINHELHTGHWRQFTVSIASVPQEFTFARRAWLASWRLLPLDW